jgi:hypothetical protein
MQPGSLLGIVSGLYNDAHHVFSSLQHRGTLLDGLRRIAGTPEINRFILSFLFSSTAAPSQHPATLIHGVLNSSLTGSIRQVHVMQVTFS